MAYLRALGSYVPERVLDNAEIGPMAGADPAWILHASGIEQRRFAGPSETVSSMGTLAAKDCLANAGADASGVGLILMASGSGERRFPGPASTVGASLGIAGVPAIDLPMASAGSLFAMALAAQLAPVYGNVLVIASEIFSRVIHLHPAGRDTAILFGDGAGACLIGTEPGFARIVDSVLHSDGELAEILTLDHDAPLHMDGRSVILHASRKLPRAITEVLERNHRTAAEIEAFLLHQANLNLLTRVAQALGDPEQRFFRNLQRYGNTSSASLLIAATEWWRARDGKWPGQVMFAAFG